MVGLGKHRLFYLSLGLIAIAIVSAQISAYYYLQKSYGGAQSATLCSSSATSTPLDSIVVRVNTLVNYGNETMKWYNETNIPANWNFYRLTLYLTSGNLQAQCYGPPLNEHYVTGINGIVNNGKSYWTLWMFCPNRGAWAVSPVGADLVRLENGQTLAWAYQVLSSPNPSQPPIAGAKMVGSCS